MRKIPSLFKRDYEGSRQVYDEVVEGSEWVLSGEGVSTIKWDGTCCMMLQGPMLKRYDRKLTKSAARQKKKDPSFIIKPEHFKPAPDLWVRAEDAPNMHTGHWPGWVPVDRTKPENKYHLEAFNNLIEDDEKYPVGSYELVGPKIQGNPYGIERHELWQHGIEFGDSRCPITEQPPRNFDGLKEWFGRNVCEGIVWHHPDGRMVKIKRKDFGLPWPVNA